jgi:hypothetical protein
MECDGCDGKFKAKEGFYRCDYKCDEDYCIKCVEGEDSPWLKRMKAKNPRRRIPIK